MEKGAMKHRCLRSQRGSVLMFTVALTVFLLVMGGLAIDLTFKGASKAELQRSLDAASLAGAGKLGFDDTVFPDARQAAKDYAAFNQMRGGGSKPANRRSEPECSERP